MSQNDGTPHVVIRTYGNNTSSSIRRNQRRNQRTPPKVKTVTLFPIEENGENSTNSLEQAEDKMIQIVEHWKRLHNEQLSHSARLRKVLQKKQKLQREGLTLKDKVLSDLRNEIKVESEKRKLLEERVSHLETRIASVTEKATE